MDYPGNGFEHYLALSNGPSITNLETLNQKIQERTYLFGHFGYDLKNELEVLSSSNPDSIGFDTLHFFEPEVLYKITNDQIECIIGSLPPSATALKELFTSNHSKVSDSIPEINSRISKSEYAQLFNLVHGHIQNGDVYELNLCMEYFAENVDLNPVDTFEKLYAKSPMPFSAFYKINDNYVLCASPERFLQKSTSGTLLSQPMKGTNASLDDPELNKERQQTLRNSPKEQSENMMIVDLVRNDLAKSCISGSVKVDELFGVYKMNHVNQMISSITGQLNPHINNLNSILNAFPMGSMTGAPKIRAMELIEKYEKTRRGLYSGSLGYFHLDGSFDFNVVIRSIQYNKNSKYLSFQAGGAITFESKMEDEYQECLLKAEVMKNVLNSNAV